MNLYATDKEYKERFDYFLEEVKMMKEINQMNLLVIQLSYPF